VLWEFRTGKIAWAKPVIVGVVEEVGEDLFPGR